MWAVAWPWGWPGDVVAIKGAAGLCLGGWVRVCLLARPHCSSALSHRYLLWLGQRGLGAGGLAGDAHLQPGQHQHGALDQPGHPRLHHVHHVVLVHPEWGQRHRPPAGGRHGPDAHRWVLPPALPWLALGRPRQCPCAGATASAREGMCLLYWDTSGRVCSRASCSH